jgi:hypothetical protein
MSVQAGYNVVKEGDLYSISDYTTDMDVISLSSNEIISLYDGEVSSIATTLSGAVVDGSILILESAWGDTYDVDNVKYYITPTLTSGVSIKYGINDGEEYSASVYSDGQAVVASGVGDARFIRIEHSCSPNVVFSINHLSIEGVKNETIGFGTASASEVSSFLIENSPVGYMSSTPAAIPVWNDNTAPVDIKVSVLPTGSLRDRYVYLSTSYSGTYYGLNGYGFSIPAFEPISFGNDSFIYDKFSSINDQWQVLEGCLQNRIYPTSEGLRISISAMHNAGFGGRPGDALLFGVMSNSSFTCNQSFTMKMKVKLLRNEFFWLYPLEVYFGISNNMPIPCVSYTTSFPYIDETSSQRPGRSGACVGVYSNYSENTYTFIYGDGDLRQYYDFTSWSSGGSFSQADYSTILYGDDSLDDDWSSDATFREFIFTWDHIDREAVGFIDKVRIGSHSFSSPPIEGSKAFFVVCSSGYASGDIIIKDFEIIKDSIYKQRSMNVNSDISATESSVSADDVYHGADKLIDGTDEEWVSGYSPTSADSFSITSDSPRDIIGFEITTPHIDGFSGNTLITNISGSASKDIEYAVKTLGVSVDGSDIYYYSVPFTSETKYTHRIKTEEGDPTTCSGASTVQFYLIDKYGTGSASPGSMNCLALREASLIEEYYEETIPAGTVADNSLPWSRGLFNNMKAYGGTNYWGLGTSTVYEVARVIDAEQLIPGVDYDTSNSVLYGGDSSSYPHDQAVFRDAGAGGVLYQNSWSFVYSVASPAWIWRKFKERNNIQAIYFRSDSGLGTHGPHSITNEFKIQYLKLGDSTFDGEWIDVPVIQTPYTGDSSEYAEYRQYFIDNNDGEWYTDIAYSYNYCPGMPSSYWYVPDDILAKKDFRWAGSWAIDGSCALHLTSAVYLEFDDPIETDAIRIVIKECLNEARDAIVYVANLTTIGVFRTHPACSYISPVFDTETSLNTERIFTDVLNLATSSGTVFVRSSETAPQYRNDYEYQTWQPWQTPLKGTIYDYETGTEGANSSLHYFSHPKHGLVIGSKVYIMPTDKDYFPVCYDYDTNAWTLLPAMASSADNARASTGIMNHAVQLSDGNIYVAVEVGEANTSRVMRYDINADAYGISGWRHLGVNRPQGATTGAMVGYGNLLYFIGSGGEVTSYDVENGTWDSSLAPMSLYGYVSRASFWPIIKGSKIYIVGGYGVYGSIPVPYIDIYDIENDVWEDPVSIPYFIGNWPYALLYGDKIYILCGQSSETGVSAVFDISSKSFDNAAVMSLASVNLQAQSAARFGAGTCWVYNDRMYVNYTGTRGFFRAKLKKETWTHGYLPSSDDGVWGSGPIATSSWKSVSSYDEIMPQKRYFQFKVQIDSEDSDVAPALLRKMSVVIPQTIADVPSGGTKDFYLKLGISYASSYEGWYSGATLYGSTDYGWGTYYTTSVDGVSLNQTIQVFSPTDSGTYYLSKTLPSVVKIGDSDYRGWFIKGKYMDTYSDPYQTISSGVVGYSTSEDGISWEDETTVIDTGSEGTYDTVSIIDCCVVRNSVSEYKAWYTGVSSADGFSRIIYCGSTDGQVWAGFTLSHDIGTAGLPSQADLLGAYAPSVIFDTESGLYFMWYSGLDTNSNAQIILCKSVSGISWSSHRVVVPFGFEGGYDKKSSHYPYVIKDVDTYRMWYVGVDASEVSRVLYTYSEDGISWTSPVRVLSGEFEGLDDVIGRMCVLSNKSVEIPNTYYNDAKIKIYNG